LLGFAIDSWRVGHRGRALSLLLLAATFFFDILYIATGRTGLVVLPVLAVALGLRYSGWKGIPAVAAVVALVASIAWVSSPYLRFRVDHAIAEVQVYEVSGALTSSGIRLELWKKSIGFVAQAPFFGHGTGSINEMFRRSVVGATTATAAMPAENPHQQIFAVAIQLGLVGAVLLVAMWTAHLALFCSPQPMAWAGLAIVVMHVVSCFFNSSLFDFTEGWFYVLGVGVIGGIVRRSTPQPPDMAGNPWVPQWTAAAANAEYNR
jgi:O-antigen ligase